MNNGYEINEDDIQKVINYLKFRDPKNADREYAIEFIEAMQIEGNEIARTDEQLAEAIRDFTRKKNENN
ncbi:hypothetical protein EKI60_05620 [Candidatus Saccharibacteria bacterium]|jgi:hypothetical protein|nr:MAG: hypothetical protein EKI60_05620 [Candidatus Saccharibacteria bacterium]